MNTNLLLLINGWAGKNSLLDNFMIFCAKDLVYLVFLVAIAWLGYAVYKKQWKSAAYFMSALATSFVVLQIMAHLYVDHRPFVDHHLTQLVAHAAGQSFPSDHTTVSVAIAFAFIYFTRFKKLGMALLFVAVLIGFARIFCGIHYPIDIAGGLLTGFIGSTLTFGAVKLIESKLQHKKLATTT